MSIESMSRQHREALSQAVAFVQARYGPWAILAAGTLVRGEGDENSDIDLYVLHDAPWRQRVQRFFAGTPVEIFVNPEASVYEYMRREAKDGRPFTAHMVSTGIVVHCHDEARLTRLRVAAELALASPHRPDEAELTRARYAAATLVEDALDRRGSDAETAMMLLASAVDSVASYWVKRRGRYQPRPKDLLAAIESDEREAGSWLRVFWSDAPAERRWEAALAFVDRVLGTRGFFEWESEQKPVGDP